MFLFLKEKSQSKSHESSQVSHTFEKKSYKNKNCAGVVLQGRRKCEKNPQHLRISWIVEPAVVDPPTCWSFTGVEHHPNKSRHHV